MQLLNEYMDYWEVCTDECGKETKKPLGRGKTGKKVEMQIKTWDETKYIN